MSKPNSLIKNLKNINKTINSLLEENLNKLKFDNLINLVGSNKIVLIFVALSFLFLSYLLVPTFYKQTEILQELKNINLKGNVSDEMIKWKTKGTELYQGLPKECSELMTECEPLNKIEENRKEKQKITFDTWKKTQ